MRRRDFLSGISLTGLGAATARAQTAPAPLSQPPNPQAAKLDDTVGDGFNRIVIARWGDGVLPNAPPFNPYPLTGDQADSQFPYDGVIAGLVTPPPAEDGIPRKVLVVATPDVPARMVFPGGVDNPDVAGREQGVTVINLQYMAGRWVTVDGGYQSRRIADGTLCQMTGPAAAPLGGTVQGVLAPRAGCVTPWGSVLLGESTGDAWLPRLAGVGYGYADPAQGPRFGWAVEFNPLDPQNIPLKRTALGRISRAGLAATQTKDGRPVVFFTQEDPAGFLFRFIAATNATDGTALDSGTLSVARIQGSAIQWLDLGTDVATLVGLAGAAAQASASPFDAPGGLALTPDSATLFLACRGNAARTQPDGLNPRAGDDNGHVISFAIPGGDVTAKSFTGSLVLVAGNPASATGTQYGPGSQAWLRQPRTLDLDTQGQLWIGTDQGGDTRQTADGLFTMQLGGGAPYAINYAYLAPKGAAIGGAAFDAATRTSFGMVRHPGATPTASFNYPATRWPTLRPNMPPQSTVIGLVQQ
jgi:secreted PhoX family phosphatase